MRADEANILTTGLGRRRGCPLTWSEAVAAFDSHHRRRPAARDIGPTDMYRPGMIEVAVRGLMDTIDARGDLACPYHSHTIGGQGGEHDKSPNDGAVRSSGFHSVTYRSVQYYWRICDVELRSSGSRLVVWKDTGKVWSPTMPDA